MSSESTDVPTSTACDACKLLAAALLGAVVGACVALLLAPKSGQEMREDLRRGAGSIGEKASAVGSTLAEKAQAGVGKARELAAGVKERVSPAEAPPAEASVEEPAEA